jgi:hypothetical protein
MGTAVRKSERRYRPRAVRPHARSASSVHDADGNAAVLVADRLAAACRRRARRDSRVCPTRSMARLRRQCGGVGLVAIHAVQTGPTRATGVAAA